MSREILFGPATLTMDWYVLGSFALAFISIVAFLLEVTIVCLWIAAQGKIKK